MRRGRFLEGPRGRFIIEDDYDAEFRMSGRPIAPLASVDVAGRVIYLNSFTKSLGAAFRIAYMALPEDLAAQFELKLGFYSNTVSPLEQLALARFIEQGHYERHVNRLRTHVKRLQDGLVGRVRESSLAQEVAFEGLDRGLYFSMRVRKGTQDRVAGALQAAGRAACLPGERPSCLVRCSSGGVGLRAQLREPQHRRTRLAVVPRGGWALVCRGLGECSQPAGREGASSSPW